MLCDFMAFIDPITITVDHLLVHLVDPRARSESVSTNTFVGDGTTTEFSLTPPSGKVRCVITVSIDGDEKVKWYDYDWDFQNSMVIFKTAPALSEAISVDFKHGNDTWILPGYKRSEKLNSGAFPRINVTTVTEQGSAFGYINPSTGRLPTKYVTSLQIDVWSLEDFVFNDGSLRYSGGLYSRYLANRVLNVLLEYAVDIAPKLFNMQIHQGIMEGDATFDNDKQLFHKIIEFSVDSLNKDKW